MIETTTAGYASSTNLKNVVDDLVSTGIPREKIRVDESKSQVQVSVADAAEPEIMEILQRHQPLSMQTQKASS